MIAAVITSMGIEEPNPATMISANILLGIAVKRVERRGSAPPSIQRLLAAASNASTVPMPLASNVARNATPTV